MWCILFSVFFLHFLRFLLLLLFGVSLFLSLFSFGALPSDYFQVNKCKLVGFVLLLLFSGMSVRFCISFHLLYLFDHLNHVPSNLYMFIWDNWARLQPHSLNLLTSSPPLSHLIHLLPTAGRILFSIVPFVIAHSIHFMLVKSQPHISHSIYYVFILIPFILVSHTHSSPL